MSPGGVLSLAGGVSAAVLIVFVLFLHDAALLFAATAAAVCFLFPEWWFVMAPAACIGLVRIFVTYDPSLGDLPGMMQVVSEQLGLTVDLTLAVVLLISWHPFIRAAVSWHWSDLPTHIARFAPLLLLFSVKLMGERVSDMQYVVEAATLAAKQAAEAVRTWWAYVALMLFSR